MNTVLFEPAARFIEDLTPLLAHIATQAIPGVRPDKPGIDVTLEAFNLVCAFIDSDGRQTEAELWALLNAFGARLDTVAQLHSPERVRQSRLTDGKRSWLAAPSLFFDVLVQADRANETCYSWRYYELAMTLAHAVCAADTVASEVELAYVERFRAVLLRAMDKAGLARPGGELARAAARGEHLVPTEAPPPTEPPVPLEVLLAELDALIGLNPVKAEVKLVTNLIQVQKMRTERGLPVVESSRHLVFTGNPGTGKTTVARLLARIYRTLGVVGTGHLVETDRAGLVAGYVGQTALKVTEVFESALGGVLLIDEAYALARGGDRDFGQEATDTLVKLVEDHRDGIVVIAAGYPAEMHRFVESNPGLRSRFPKTIFFPDYGDDELVAIFEMMAKKGAYTCSPHTLDEVRAFFAAQVRDKGFGNARLARNLFEAAMAHQASRIVARGQPTDEQLVELTPADVSGPVAQDASGPTSP